MNHFVLARPIWPTGQHQAMNLVAGFRCVITTRNGNGARLRLTARTTYRAWINGQLLGYGPARSAHGHMRVDEWPLTGLTAGPHVIAIEVNAANVPHYAATDEHPLLQAEVEVDGDIVAATGDDTWQALIPGERCQRVARLSRQRAFAEAYRLTPESSAWRSPAGASFMSLPVDVVAQPVMLPRRVPYPDWQIVTPVAWTGGGSIEVLIEPVLHKWETWMRADSGNNFAGFPADQWEIDMSDELGRWRCHVEPGAATRDLTARTWRMVDFGVNLTGFLRARVHCREATVLYLGGDELAANGDCDVRRLEYMAAARYELAPGTYDLEMFEPVTARYMKIMVATGSVRIEELSLREYARPTNATFTAFDPKLDQVFEAAVRTFAQNAVDIFMDCPSRERAGWLCDSFFTSRVEPWLTGGCTSDTLFIENYTLRPELSELPAGMLPKCYPGDGPMVRGGPARFIPNWALWLVLEVAEHPARDGDPGVVAAFRSRCVALFDYLDQFRNADGLLEKIDSWVFVDWSSANEHVQDVSYPTNMLYAAGLDAAGRLYGHTPWIDRAAAMRALILRQAWDGRYFHDNAQRDEQGRLVLTENHTETCQYYAFYFGLATPKSHAALWNELITTCSVALGVANPNLPRAGHFVGFQMRLSLMGQYGLTDQLVNEIRLGFSPMAELTGTLWEHEHTKNSCNHGFASHVAHLLFTHVLGVTIDRVRREIRWKAPRVNLPGCQARIPLGDGWLAIGWQREETGAKVAASSVPAGWRLVY